VAVTEVAVAEVTVAASAVLNLTAVGAVVKVPPPACGVIVTLVPTAPLLGVPFVGTSGHVPAAPVVKAKVAESPDVLWTFTVVAVPAASVGEVGRPTSAWVSASTDTNVPTWSVPAWLNVTDVMGPPFATV
jgi:hypothetical protein